MCRIAGILPAVCAALILSCAGCSRDIVYDYSTGCVQIGCRWDMDRQSPETSYSRIGFPWWFSNNENAVTYGLDITPATYDNGTLNGLGVSLASMRNETNGILVSPICSLQDRTCGLSLSPVNVNLKYSPSMQVGLWNHSGCSSLFDPFNGAAVQLALLNQAGRTDVQFGLGNICTRSSEFQLGLVNSGYSIPKQTRLKRTGWQLGLVNFSENGALQIGLLNVNETSAFCKWFPLVNFAGPDAGLPSGKDSTEKTELRLRKVQKER